ncbi:hypothetical protein DMJ13_19445 [halophilic archaeon]|nr:hypothetical protein DMJ13_19445 [halophilic archaeon]
MEYCVDNLPNDLRAALPAECVGWPCLQRCGLCYDEPFLAVDGELVTGDDHEELLADAGVSPDR